jgi:magnesium transporter
MNMSDNLRHIPLADVLFDRHKRVHVFLELPLDQRLELLDKVTRAVRKDILNRIPEADLVSIVQAVDPDDATDMLQLLGKKKRESALLLLSDEVKDSLSTLLEFDADTAAGLMTLDYIQVQSSDNIATIAKQFKQHEKRTGRLPVILVFNNSKLMGFLPGHELGFATQRDRAAKFTKRISSIKYSQTHHDVIDLFRRHPHNKIAVINDDGNVVGIIYSDDVIRLVDDKANASLYDFAGVSEEESVTDSSKSKVKHRYKWLIINLGTAFLASFVVGQFQGLIAQYVLLAVYMPIVAGMGGNAATQTLAVLVRGITLKQISLGTAMKTLKNEVSAGAFNGVINGILVAVVVILKDHDFKIALVLALAMIINLIVAATFGTMVPLIMSKLRKDPAASATIFITTATDVLGFLAFLGLATLILK